MSHDARNAGGPLADVKVLSMPAPFTSPSTTQNSPYPIVQDYRQGLVPPPLQRSQPIALQADAMQMIHDLEHERAMTMRRTLNIHVETNALWIRFDNIKSILDSEFDSDRDGREVTVRFLEPSTTRADSRVQITGNGQRTTNVGSAREL
ncbi:hypothetical protein NMY22_g6727 [Coprinellus aureogranulatus]|nr:hypothetical protein NMY22_g6727 [Coprinellus aureogranulatus]